MFYENYIKLCIEHGVKPSNVGLQCGVSRSAVTAWKHGTKPSDVVLRTVADFFEVTPEWLLTDHVNEQPFTSTATPAVSDERTHFDMAVYTALFGYGDAQELTDADKADVEFAVELIKARLKARRENKL